MLSTPERLRASNRTAATRRRRSSLTAAGPGGAAGRARLAAAFARCTTRDRVVLALMLVERLSLSEAADAMGISAARLRRVYGDTLAQLRLAWCGLGGSARPRARRGAVGSIRLRKAV